MDYEDASAPDSSHPDYYCNMCDSHMNSIQMWESHISGKRHLKNKRKHPNEAPSKVKSFKVTDTKPLLEEELRQYYGREIIVGLNHITETLHADSSLAPSYSCHCCNAQTTRSGATEHILTMKHRMNYLKYVDSATYDNIMSMKLQKHVMEPLVLEHCAKWCEKDGPGTIEVKIEKPSLPIPSSSSWKCRKELKGGPGETVESEFNLSADKGIREIDLFSDHLSLDMEIDLMYRAVTENKIAPPGSEEDIQRYLNCIQLTDQAIASYKIRQLSREEKMNLTKVLMSGHRPLERVFGSKSFEKKK